MSAAPLPYVWTGDAAIPLDRALRAAREQCGEGEIIWLVRYYGAKPEAD